MEKKKLTPHVDKLIALGKKKGHLTYEEINNLLPEEVTSSHDIDVVFERLTDAKIELVDKDETPKELGETPLEEDEQEERKPPAEEPEEPPVEVVQIDDPVKMYLRQMGQIPLLKREAELELAKRIEAAEHKFRDTVLESKLAKQKILDLFKKIEAEEVHLEDVVKEEPKYKQERFLKHILDQGKKLKETRSNKRILEILIGFTLVPSVVHSIALTMKRAVDELEGLQRQLKRLKGRAN